MSKHLKSTWYILGAGAVGCLWASYFRLAGLPVVLITQSRRDATAITLSNESGRQLIDVEQISIDELNRSTQQIELLLVTTKAQQCLEAITAIEKNLAVQASILILQNGMAAESVASRFTTQSLFLGITTDGCYRTDPMTVIHAGKGKTLVGSYDPATPCEDLLQQLPLQQLDISYCKDIVLKQWQKLAINCAINGLTVIYQCRNGELLNNKAAMSRMQRICDEVLSVTKALKLPQKDFNNLFMQTKKTLLLTADNYSSMYQDIQQKRNTEIDFINGYISQQASQLGIYCPENQQVIDQIKQRELHFLNG